jgi:hypothetical protein
MRALDLEMLLIAAQSLRKHEAENRNHLFEIERAIELIQGGVTNSHTDCVMRWVSTYLAGAA